MAYTVKNLSELSGVTVRTLHFYEEAELLIPAYYGSNGYRYYEEKQLLQLQQILFFKELGFSLKADPKSAGTKRFRPDGEFFTPQEGARPPMGKSRTADQDQR